MALQHIGNTDFYYEYHGKGQPLVLIAGYSCDHTFWDAILEELSRHFQILVFDNRGIGQTKDTTSELTLELMADDTFQLIQALNIKQPIVLGQSMGGAIAQLMARKYSHDLSKLIILNSSSKFNVRTFMMLESLLHLFKEEVSFDGLMDASMPWFFSGRYLSDPKNIATYKSLIKYNPYPVTVEILERQLRALKSFNSQTWLSTLNIPTVVIASDDDIVAIPSDSEEIAQKIPNAKLLHIASSHASPIDNPKEVITAILKAGKDLF